MWSQLLWLYDGMILYAWWWSMLPPKYSWGFHTRLILAPAPKKLPAKNVIIATLGPLLLFLRFILWLVRHQSLAGWVGCRLPSLATERLLDAVCSSSSLLPFSLVIIYGSAALVQLGCLHAPTGCAFLLFWFNVLNSSSAQKEGLDSKLARTISLVVIMLELTGGTPVHAHWQCNGSCSLWCHAWRTPFSSSSLERTRNTASIGLNRNVALEWVALQSCYTVGTLKPPTLDLCFSTPCCFPILIGEEWKLPQPEDLMRFQLCNFSMIFHAFCSATSFVWFSHWIL